MGAGKAPRGDALLELVERFAEEVAAAGDPKAGVVARGFDPVDLAEQQDLRTVLRRNDDRFVLVGSGARSCPQAPRQPLDRRRETSLTHGLDEVVMRLGVERPNGELVVSREEDN